MPESIKNIFNTTIYQNTIWQIVVSILILRVSARFWIDELIATLLVIFSGFADEAVAESIHFALFAFIKETESFSISVSAVLFTRFPDASFFFPTVYLNTWTGVPLP